jgi:septum formation protein
MSDARCLWLASASPRRRQLLEEAGVAMRVLAPDIDDGVLRPGPVPPAQWVAALAYLKARRVADLLRTRGAGGTVLAADTVCVVCGAIVGQPADADAARLMIRALRGREHETFTGVCLLALQPSPRTLFADRAVVRVGPLSDTQIDRYVESEEWIGKAGGYNLAERLDAGWPMEFRGDPTSVMGLPMRRLRPLLTPWDRS